MRVAIFVGTRADLGPLEPVIAAFAEAGHDTHLLTGVAFDAESLAARTAHIPGATVHALTRPVGELTPAAMTQQSAAIMKSLGELFADIAFDVCVVLGDRWELLSVVPAAFLAGIKIVHIHGGEVTEGAIDERVRHAVTKLADVHCAASADAAQRIAQMGEPRDRIFVTGAPGLDRIASAAPATDAELSALLGREVVRPLALFTYHPPTATRDAPLEEWTRAALGAALAVCGTVIVTDPGVDEGRERILATLDEMAVSDDRIVRIPSLGARYPMTLRAVDVVVGNSSSGVIEAASAGVPAVDIGSRQAGRLRAASVVHAGDVQEEIRSAVERALEFARNDGMLVGVVNPYGEGDSARRIVAAASLVGTFPVQKEFVDQD
jgi:UDP-N-acetylglucosamine 2-epimerase (non-hydrolysing)